MKTLGPLAKLIEFTDAVVLVNRSRRTGDGQAQSSRRFMGKKPLVPPEKPRPKCGWPRPPDRLALTGIQFVARTCTAWEFLPPPPPSPELGLGSGITWWQRLRELQDSGVRQKVWHVFLDELGLAYRIDRSKAVVDSRSVRALYLGGAKTGPNPTDRGKNGSKRHLISDCKGIPLAVI